MTGRNGRHLTIAGIVLTMVLIAGLGLAAVIGRASYSITILTVNGNPAVSGMVVYNPVELTGSFSVASGSGHEDQYGVAIDWYGDGSVLTVWKYSDPGKGSPYVTWNPNNNPSANTFTGTFNTNPDPSHNAGHTYALGSFTIVVKIFHENNQGNEDASSSLDITVKRRVTFYTNPTTGTITAGGVTKNNGDIGLYGNGATVTIVPNAPAGYHFTGWVAMGGVSVNTGVDPNTMTVTGNGNLTANFADCQYTVTFHTLPNTGTITAGGVSKSDGQTGTYSYGAVVSIVPVAPAHYHFTGWTVSGGVSVNTVPDPDTMTVTGDGSLTANFAINQYTVTFHTLPNTGSITVGGVSKSDGSTGTYSHGDVVPIIPVAPAHYHFTGWSATGGVGVNEAPDPDEMTVTGDGSLTANFAINQYTVTFHTLPNTGTITAGGVSKSDGQTGGYGYGDVVQIVPNAPAHYHFTSWSVSGGVSVNTVPDPDTMTVTGDGSLTANFAINQYTVSFAQTGSGVNPTVEYRIDAGSHTTDTVPFDVNVDSGQQVSYTYEQTVPGAAGVRYVLTGVSPISPQTIAGDLTITGTYKTQFSLTMTTNYGTVSPGSGWHDEGSHVTISAMAPIAAAGERYVWLGWTGTGSGSYSGAANSAGITMDGPITEAAAWRKEISLIVESLYDAPDPTVGTHWYVAGTSIEAVVTSPTLGPSGTRYVCTGWTGSGSVPATGSTTAVTFVIHVPSTITWLWGIQYYLNVTSAHGTTGGQGWYDPGTTAYALVTPLVVEEPGGVRYVFANWSGDASGTTSPSDPILMDRSKIAIANWDLELRLDVISAYDNPTGAGWYKPNTTAHFGVITPIDLGNRTLLVFLRWSGDVNQTEPTGTIVMTKPSRVVASWEVQYLLTFNTTLPNNLILIIPGLPQVLPPGSNLFEAYYAAGSSAEGGPAPAVVSGTNGTRYVFEGWVVDGEIYTPDSSFSLIVHSPHDVSAVYGTEYRLIVDAKGVSEQFTATLTIAASPAIPHNLTPTSPVLEWLGLGTSVTLGISSPNKIGHGEWAIFEEWARDAQGSARTASLVISAPKVVDAMFFQVNPVAMSIPYSLVAGLICVGISWFMSRGRPQEETEKQDEGQRGMTYPVILGILVSIVVLAVAAIMSSSIATGYLINTGELLDFTNWAVVFSAVEVLAFLLLTVAIVRGFMSTKAAGPAKVPTNPYGV